MVKITQKRLLFVAIKRKCDINILYGIYLKIGHFQVGFEGCNGLFGKFWFRKAHTEKSGIESFFPMDRPHRAQWSTIKSDIRAPETIFVCMLVENKWSTRDSLPCTKSNRVVLLIIYLGWGTK